MCRDLAACLSWKQVRLEFSQSSLKIGGDTTAGGARGVIAEIAWS
jgi:hypothetical protein